MLTRLWFVVSLIWAALLLYFTFTSPTHNYRIEGSPVNSLGFWFWVFLPFLIGLIIRIVFRYVVTGNPLRRVVVAFPKRPADWR